MSNKSKNYNTNVPFLHKSNCFLLRVVSSPNAIFGELESKLHGNSQSHLFHIKHSALEIQFSSEQGKKVH